MRDTLPLRRAARFLPHLRRESAAHRKASEEMPPLTSRAHRREGVFRERHRARTEPKPHLAAQGRFPRKAPNADSRCPTRRARAARYRGRTPRARSRSSAPFRGSSPRVRSRKEMQDEPCRAARLRVRRSARETKIPLPRRVPHLRQDPRRERT